MFEPKTAEARARRKSKKIGWRVEKSRARQLHCNNKGLFQLVDDRNIVVGGVDYDATIEKIEFWVDQEISRRS